MKKVFSVIIPVYNAELTIERTLASLISNREYISEVILVNDRSTDNTFDKIDQFRQFFPITVIDNTGNKGPGVARKTGMLHAKSPWITFVDSDDCLTPSSLRYVYERIIDSDILLLHCQTIYYESGNFTPKTISHSDTSCGGNFYNREYLIEHELYPHDELYMVEDEYFNEKVITYITYCDDELDEGAITYYDYPVYEVHHDIDDELSFALGNWADYTCKYSLLYKEYLVEDFIQYKYLYNMLFDEFCSNFIFCFFMLQGVMLDEEIDLDLSEYKKYFKSAVKCLKDKFNKTEDDLIDYYNSINTDELLHSAHVSVGIEFENYLSFGIFVKTL